MDNRVRDLHRRAIEAINSGRPAVGARLLRTALRELGWPDAEQPPALTARVLWTLAAAEVALGNSDRSFALLDSAAEIVAPGDRGALLQQRGLVLMMVGRMAEALDCQDEAIPLLRQVNDLVMLTRALLNRGMLHQIAGRGRLALADLDQCEQVCRHLDAEEGVARRLAKAVHTRGQCRVLTGDIPAALRDFDIAAEVYAGQGDDGMLVILATHRAQALLAAGLASEAATELDAALHRFPGLRMNQEHAEAELTRARAALAAGHLAEARSWAARARRRFHRQGNETWEAVAALTTLRAEFAAGRRTARIADGAAELAVRLRTLGLRNDADEAVLLAARANIGLGRLDSARALAGRDRPGAPLETRLLRRLALAELGAVGGNRRRTFAEARSGLTLLREHRGRFGSLDLQTGTTSLGGELASAGLAAALENGSPDVVFRWLERSRAQAFQFRPVRTPADVHTVDAVAELRQLARQVRAAELAGSQDPGALRRCRYLERKIRSRGWQVDGTGERHADVTFAEVTAELDRSSSVMVSFLADGDRLHAQVIGNGRAALLGLGAASAVDESVARLHSDLDAACGRRLHPGLHNVIHTSIRRQLNTLAGHLLDPLLGELGDLDVVLVPTGALSAVPWGLLAPLRGRPVTVTPSPSTWVSAKRTTRAAGPVLLVGGPNLQHSSDEVNQLAKIYPDSTLLDRGDATVEATLKAVDRSGLAHFASHGHHEQENVLFSRLDLVDGPLMAHDIHQLAAAPDHVVLSSCDIGQTVVRTGDEILGFTAALLYSGSRTVVSSVARVDDRAAVGVMVAYHRALARGVASARALADATQTEPLMPFVCHGWGG